jgi:dTDP-4-dehydrorhamnose reductase
MRVLLTGAEGQLGAEIVAAWHSDGLIALGRPDLDITDQAAVEAAVARHHPALVVNTAAFTNVDRCETEVERAFAVNAFGPLHLADACRARGAALMHISTDYVFDGGARTPYKERDTVCPRSVYGLSKATGEQFVRTRTPQHYIIRTAGLYGSRDSRPRPANFVERMLQLAREGRAIRVVDDQITSPTSASDLAPKLREIATTGRFGTFHVTNAGACSWYEFATAIFELANVPAQLEPTSTADYGATAPRPPYSVLANDSLTAAGIPPMRHWREALADYLSARRP